MADPEAGQPPRTDRLELQLGEPAVTLQQLVSAGNNFAGLLREVATDFLGDEGAVRWVVNLEPGSVKVPTRPELTTDEVAPSALIDLVVVIAEGLALIEAKAERPPHFSDRALERAKSLANLPSVTVRNGAVRTPLSARLVANADEVIGAPRASFGTVEGRLEAVNIHGRPMFAVWDALTGERAECYFGDRIPLEDIGAAIGQRVAVRGRIRTRPTGTKEIDVLHLRRFPSEDELPSPEEVLGILKRE